MHIQILGDGELLREVDLSAGSVVIGRAEECDVVLPYGYISLRHAEIGLYDGHVYVRDLGSTNGVLINDQEIDQSTYIEPGLPFVIGEMTLTFSVSPTESGLLADTTSGVVRDEGIPAPVEEDEPTAVLEEESVVDAKEVLDTVGVESVKPPTGGTKRPKRKKHFRKILLGIAACLAILLTIGGGVCLMNVDPVLSLVAEGRLSECKDLIEERLRKCEASVSGDDSRVFSKVLENDEYTLDLARFEILRACGVDDIEELFWLDRADEFLKLLFNDRLWMESLLAEGPPPDVGSAALYRLYSIWRTDPECATHPVYHKLAVASAIGGGRYDPDQTSAVNNVRQYSWYRKYHEMGRLHKSFDSLPAWLMKIALLGDVKAATFCNADRNGTTGSFFGSCWACGYKRHNVFSDSIHGRDYYPPWMHRMTRMEANRKVGGVCGSLSTYASYIHKSHGIPSATAGQPGHCAFVRRDPSINSKGSWRVGYSIKNPTNTRISYWSGSASYLNFMEDVFRDWGAVLRSCRHIWQARMHQDRFERENGNDVSDVKEKTVVLSPSAKVAYNLAVRAHPIHRGIWNIYNKVMEKESDVSTIDWQDNAEAIALAMKNHSHPMRDAIAKPMTVLKDRLSTPDKISLIVKLYKILGSEAGMSNLKYIDDVEGQFQLLGRLFDMYEAGSRDWTAVVGAGRNMYATNVDLMLRFNKMISNSIGTGTKSAGANVVISSLRTSLLLAAKDEDIDSYNTLFSLLTDIYSGEELGSRHFNQKQEAAFPKFEPFGGRLLSADGILRTSSSNGKYDVPQLHPAVLKNDPRGGWCMTNSEKEPWAMVVLPGPAKLSGIIIVNRYETEGYKKSQVPLHVEVSVDGKTWTEVFTTETPEALWRINLGEKDVQAKYVRCKADHDEKADIFHLRSILVYGEKLY